MKLMNVAGTAPTNIPLLYVCCACGCMLTIPPPNSPLDREDARAVADVIPDIRPRIRLVNDRLE